MSLGFSKLKALFFTVNRVCHSLREIREFSSWKKSQGSSGNFQNIENLRETYGSFKNKKPQKIFFLDLEWDLVNPVSICVQKN